MKRFNNKLIYTLYFVLVSFFLQSCSGWAGDYDFRNYLRDKHPYSVIKKTNLGRWSYQVNDTIKGTIWIYTSSKSKSSIRSHCINCE